MSTNNRELIRALSAIERHFDTQARNAAERYNRLLPRESKRWKDEHEDGMYLASVARRAARALEDMQP